MSPTDTRDTTYEGQINPNIVSGSLTCELPVSQVNITTAGKCSIGAFTYSNYQTEMTNTHIGRYCSIAQRVIINPGQHPMDYLSTHPFCNDPSGVSAGLSGVREYDDIAGTAFSLPSPKPREVHIGNDVWIGASAIVMAGVSIGDGAVVGAGTIVTHDVEPYAIVVGVPGRRLRFRFTAETIARLLALRWWNYDLSAVGPDRDYTNVVAILDKLAVQIAEGNLPLLRPKTLHIQNSQITVCQPGFD